MNSANKDNLTVMHRLALDTTVQAQDKLLELLRDVPAKKKLLLTFELIDTTRLLVLAGLRKQFPAATEEELRRRLISRLLPREQVMAAYGFDPNVERP